MLAFEDDSITAVMATIGGDDQITVLRHLDPARMLAHPKRFLGYSDNTNLSNWLWFLGVGGVYGGSTSVHLGPGPRVDGARRVPARLARLAVGVARAVSLGDRHGVGWVPGDRGMDARGRSLGAPRIGERGILGAASALLWGRPPVSSREQPRTEAEAAELRTKDRDVLVPSRGGTQPSAG